MRRHALLIAITLTFSLAATKVDPPLRQTVRFRTGKSAVVQVVEFDDEHVTLVSQIGNSKQFAWTELEARSIFAVHSELLRGRAVTGEQWANVGLKLLTVSGGKPFAERAFERAVRLDPSLKDQIEQAKRDAREHPTVAPPRTPASKPAATTQEWGDQTEEQTREAVAKLKQEMIAYQRLTPARLTLFETRHFLLYSNLAQSESERWAAVLDRMYERLAELFALAKGQNIWYGKAIVIVFQNAEQFTQFEKAAYRNTVGSHGGFCHYLNEGRVHIVFAKAADDLFFARTLVHESTHGFLHRYRSRKEVPTWLNEGLAEVISHELVPHAGMKQSEDARARSILMQTPSLEQFLISRDMTSDQYQIARTLSEFIIRQNKSGYVSLINHIKDGEDWEQALPRELGVDMATLVAKYGESMGVRELKP